MKKWLYRWVSVLLIFVSIITVTLLAGCAENNDDTIEITDMSGTVVEIPRSPKKIAAVSPSTGDLMIAFGLGELLDGTYFSTLDNPWATEIYPEAKIFTGMTMITALKHLSCVALTLYLSRNLQQHKCFVNTG